MVGNGISGGFGVSFGSIWHVGQVGRMGLNGWVQVVVSMENTHGLEGPTLVPYINLILDKLKAGHVFWGEVVAERTYGKSVRIEGLDLATSPVGLLEVGYLGDTREGIDDYYENLVVGSSSILVLVTATVGWQGRGG